MGPETAAKRVLRARLCDTSLRQHSLIGNYEQERQHLFELIKRMAVFGESNSALVIGQRGSGKTTLMKSVLAQLQNVSDVRKNLIQVHLNGLLQWDDSIAMKEIARQLQLENTLGDRVFGSFAETLTFLLESIKSGNKQSLSILFVIEEFDLFAQHKNQTLLYNLFDVSQSAQTPVCIIGITCRLDVIELLEKRVKSRFSHRQIYLSNNITFEDYVQIFRETLLLPNDFVDKKFSKKWNTHIKSLSCSSDVRSVLQDLFHTTKDIRKLHMLLLMPICKVSESHSCIEESDIKESYSMIMADSKAAILHGLSVLEVCLVIAVKHISLIYHGEPFNFEMIYEEYKKFSQRRSTVQRYTKPVVQKAFEHLVALELIVPMESSNSRIQKEYQLMASAVDPSQLAEALDKYSGLPTEIKQWSESSVS